MGGRVGDTCMIGKGAERSESLILDFKFSKIARFVISFIHVHAKMQIRYLLPHLLVKIELPLVAFALEIRLRLLLQTQMFRFVSLDVRQSPLSLVHHLPTYRGELVLHTGDGGHQLLKFGSRYR